jgi:hypothetical protein
MRIQPTDMETNNQPATRNTTTGVTPKYGDFYWAKMPSCHPQTWECHQKTEGFDHTTTSAYQGQLDTAPQRHSVLLRKWTDQNMNWMCLKMTCITPFIASSKMMRHHDKPWTWGVPCFQTTPKPVPSPITAPRTTYRWVCLKLGYRLWSFTFYHYYPLVI